MLPAAAFWSMYWSGAARSPCGATGCAEVAAMIPFGGCAQASFLEHGLASFWGSRFCRRVYPSP
jgi:hypothetical protein